MGIGILTRNDLLILSQFNILAIPLLIWVIDFFYIYFFGNSLLGITDYFFIEGPLIGKIISSQHLFTIPLILYTLYLLKIKTRKAHIVSFIEVTLIFLFSRLFSNFDENINCVFKPCMNLPYFHYYPLVWFIVLFIMVYFTNYIMINLRFFNRN